MHVLILGATGFIGSHITASLLAAGHTVCATARSGGSGRPAADGLAYATWDGKNPDGLRPLLEHADAVINLQGENIGAARWTRARKQAIVQSRLDAGYALVTALHELRHKNQRLPQCLLQASACGYYGLWPDAATAPPCTEHSPAGQGFLARTCVQWEASTAPVEDMGIRRCILRFSPVLGKKSSGAAGGFLERMLPPFRYFMGGPVGSGHQPVSWIHMEDVTRIALFLLAQNGLCGTFNASAPETVSMRRFAHTLGSVCARPVWLPVPASLVRLALGEMAEELILCGQNPFPSRLADAGYAFRYGSLEQALADTLA
ncbi:TIGR01777 family oxidoreductase [Desulfovibrio falkowii]|uniref:TIGR01777 family oxidoreductase n=1 Tax=Desulfovibrio sp. WGS1351 TaxID=3366814 RepID=UPI00372D32F9